jgi:hypothetical protein
MATKKKALIKKPRKMKAPRPVLEIFILPDVCIPCVPGGVFPDFALVDGNGVKHPPKVFWQAVDVTKNYRIVLTDPPKPFKKDGPFPTDVDGATEQLTVDKNLPNRTYTYTVQTLTTRGRWKAFSGGGIIVDA